MGMRPAVTATLAVSLLAACTGSTTDTVPAPTATTREVAGASAETRTLAFVSAEAEDRLVAVNLERRRVVGRLRVADGPHNVAASQDGRHVVVTSPPAGRITIVDGRSLRVRRVLAGFGSPHDVEILGGYAYATDEARGQLVVVDLGRGRVVSRVAVGPKPHDLAVDGDHILVTSRASSLVRLDRSRPARPRVVGRSPAGGPAHDIANRPDTPEVFVTYWSSGVLGRIDWGRGRVLFERRLGTLTHHVAFDHYSGRRVWVTDHVGGKVLLVSADDGRILRTIGGCPGAHHVAMAGPGLAAIACHDSGRLLIHDVPRARTASIRVGHGLHGVAVALVTK